MSTNFLWVLPLAFSLLSDSAQAAGAKQNQSQSVTVNVNVNQNPYTNYVPGQSALLSGAGLGYYQNLLNTCAAATENLSYTRELAEDDARAGNFKEASRKLFEALIFEAGNIGSLPYAPFPNAALAIMEASYIANSLKTATAQAATPPATPPSTTPAPGPSNPPSWFPPQLHLSVTGSALGQVEFVVLSQLYDMINKAYSIDARWYTALIVPRCYQNWRTCYNSNYSPNPYWLPQAYFDSVRQLAIAVLEVQQTVQHLEYSDVVEFAVSRSVANSAKAILTTALYRRDLICSIRELHMLEARIGYIQSGGSSLTDVENRSRIRGLMSRAINNLKSVCMPHYGRPYRTSPPHQSPYPSPYPITPVVPNPPYLPYQSGTYQGRQPQPYQYIEQEPQEFEEQYFDSNEIEAPYVDRYGNQRIDIRDRENLDRALQGQNVTNNERYERE